jgi:elongation factor G
MAKNNPNDIRNLALVGHGGSGKTTLADHLLFKAKAVDRCGNVDDGTSVSDFDEEAKKRHHTLDAVVLHFEHAGKHVNLIDTPGFPDFVGQALCGLQAVETAAVVINAGAGVEVNARRMFNEAKRRGLARFFIINKLDGDNIDFEMLFDNMVKSFGGGCVLFNAPLGIGAGIRGVVSVLEPPATPPADCPVDLESARAKLIEAVVEVDETLMEKYLGEGAISQEELLAAIPKAVAAGNVMPVFCCAAKKDVGISELMTGIVQFAPSPVQGLKRKLADGTPIEPTETGKALGQVFKVVNDKFVGTLSFVRLYSGRMASDQPIFNARIGKATRTSGFLGVLGKNSKPISEAVAGDIFAIAKVDDLHMGDTIGQEGAPRLPAASFPAPMFGLAVEPKARGDEQKISGSLAKMADEDPTFKVLRDPQTKELVIQGMSQLHLDVIQARLKRRFDLEVNTHEPKIPYRETITANGEGQHRHKKQTGGAGQFGEVHLRVYPLPRTITNLDECKTQFMNKQRFPTLREDHCHYDPEFNFAFIDTVVGGTIPNQFIPAVYKGCLELMERGAVAGYRLQDIAVEVYFGKDHPVDSKEIAFKTAARVAFKNGILSARPVILEPIVNLEVTVPSKYTGTILGDLNTRRGRIENQDSLPGDLQVIYAKAPLAEVMRYKATLDSVTQGQGSYTMEFSHYDQVPGNIQQQIIAKAVKVKDEDEE